MAALVISNDKATLHELRTVYSLKDLFDLWELCVIPIINQRRNTEYQRQVEKNRKALNGR